jgi:hypothetical protein
MFKKILMPLEIVAQEFSTPFNYEKLENTSWAPCRFIGAKLPNIKNRSNLKGYLHVCLYEFVQLSYSSLCIVWANYNGSVLDTWRNFLTKFQLYKIHPTNITFLPSHLKSFYFFFKKNKKSFMFIIYNLVKWHG